MGFEYTLVTSKIWGGNPVIPDGPAKASPLWKKVYDTLRGLRDATLATLVWSGDFAVSGSAANNFTVEIGAISCITLLNSDSHNLPFAYAGGTIDQTKVQGGGGTLGAAADWWYVYAYINGSSLDWEISQTAPTGNLMFKTGDNTRRFIGCFSTNGSGVPYAVRARHGRYVYTEQQNLASSLKATAATAVSLATHVPAHARLAKLNLRTFKPNPGLAARSCVVGGVAIHSASVDTAAEGYTETAAEVVLSASQEVTYQWTTQDSTPGEESELAIDVIGWE